MSTFVLDNLDVRIRYQEDLSKYTTFRLGGACKGLITCQTPEQLYVVVNKLLQANEKFILIGGGSNLVVSDQGVDCFVIRFVSDIPLIEREDNTLTVTASSDLDTLALFAAKEGLEGLNCCTGIPGTVGGAVVGNAGAFGKQIGDKVVSLNVLTETGEIKTMLPQAAGFSYRYSKLKDSRDIVLSVRLKLESGSAGALLQEREEILALRRNKHPDLEKHPCAGSFFRNIEPTSQAGQRQAAGWFLEQAGVKSFRCGGACIFEKHANIIVKGPGCSSEDVYDLHQRMQLAVKEKFDIDLVREVRFVGAFERAQNSNEAFIW